MNRVIKRGDRAAIKSAASLQAEMGRSITKVFVTALECIEIKFGSGFEGYDELRAKILRVGNDEKRRIQEVIERYNVEAVPDIVTFVSRVSPGSNGEAEEISGEVEGV